MQANFAGSSPSTTIPWKAEFINGYINFELQDQWKSSAKKQKHLDLAGSWMQNSCQSECSERICQKKSQKVHQKIYPKAGSFTSCASLQKILIKDLHLYPYPDNVKTHASWRGKMFCDVPLIQEHEHDRNGIWIL